MQTHRTSAAHMQDSKLACFYARGIEAREKGEGTPLAAWRRDGCINLAWKGCRGTCVAAACVLCTSCHHQLVGFDELFWTWPEFSLFQKADWLLRRNAETDTDSNQDLVINLYRS